MKERKYLFSCPNSSQIAWGNDLIYKECPLAYNQRDYEQCKFCKLKNSGLTDEAMEKNLRRKGQKLDVSAKKAEVTITESETGTVSVEPKKNG